MCFVWISEQPTIISLYSINWLVCITETGCVYCAVRTGSLYIIQVMCFVWISEQTAIISLYSIKWLVFRSVRIIAKNNYKLGHVCPSVRMQKLGSHWTEFDEIWYLSIFLKFVQKIPVWSKSDHNNGTLHADRYTFMVNLIIMKNVSDKNCRENQNTHLKFNNPPPPHVGIIWKHMA